MFAGKRMRWTKGYANSDKFARARVLNVSWRRRRRRRYSTLAAMLEHKTQHNGGDERSTRSTMAKALGSSTASGKTANYMTSTIYSAYDATNATATLRTCQRITGDKK